MKLSWYRDYSQRAALEYIIMHDKIAVIRFAV